MSVSVVVPAYNAEKYLLDCLVSIKKQNLVPDQVILVDDGSTDDTVGIARENGVQVARHEKNMGIGYSRQHGAEIAASDYVGFLSADDSYLPCFLSTMLEYADGKAILFSDYYRCNEKQQIQSVFTAPHYDSQEAFRNLAIQWALRKNMFTCFSTVLIPHWVFNQVTFHKELRHGEDLVFLLETVKHGVPWVHVEQPLVKYRVHSQSGTRKARNEVEWQQLWNAQTPILKMLGVSDERIMTAKAQNHKVAFPTILRRIMTKRA